MTPSDLQCIRGRNIFRYCEHSVIDVSIESFKNTEEERLIILKEKT